jgi:hypothetical protein
MGDVTEPVGDRDDARARFRPDALMPVQRTRNGRDGQLRLARYIANSCFRHQAHTLFAECNALNSLQMPPLPR